MSHKLFIFSLLVLFFGCKKYDEDDRRYFKSPCGRVAKKWALYKITDKNGKDYADSLIHFTSWSNDTVGVEYSFTYQGMELEFSRSRNFFCGETGITGSVKCNNKPFSSGYYELKFKRTMFKFDVGPDRNSPYRYFIDDYTIFKMTSDELIFGRGEAKAYFKVTN